MPTDCPGPHELDAVAAQLDRHQRAYVAATAAAPPSPIDPGHRMLIPATRQTLQALGILDPDGYMTRLGVQVGLHIRGQQRRPPAAL